MANLHDYLRWWIIIDSRPPNESGPLTLITSSSTRRSRCSSAKAPSCVKWTRQREHWKSARTWVPCNPAKSIPAVSKKEKSTSSIFPLSQSFLFDQRYFCALASSNPFFRNNSVADSPAAADAIFVFSLVWSRTLALLQNFHTAVKEFDQWPFLDTEINFNCWLNDRPSVNEPLFFFFWKLAKSFGNNWMHSVCICWF